MYRLEVGAEIADLPEPKVINAKDLAARLAISKQSISHELQTLEQAGLIARTEAAEDSARKVYFRAEESRYWAWCLQARDEAKTMLSRTPPF